MHDRARRAGSSRQARRGGVSGLPVRKDLVRRYARQYPVSTYVVEFLLGRYCASVDEQEIEEGLAIVERQLQGRTVRTSDQEIFKSRAREDGSVKLIDVVRARLDAKNDCYVAELPSLNLRDVQVADSIVKDNERILADGFYAEVTLSYDPLESHDVSGRPFRIALLRPIQMSKPDVLDVLARGRRAFTTADWRDFLIRSAGLEAETLDEPAKRVVLLRMAPFVERNYNFVELGPRGTGKSHIYQQLSPYSHLLSGGKATVARMFVNMANGQRGLVCQYDVVCFDEIAGISFDQKDGVNIMKGYMASGEFSRGKESIRADGGIVMVGNFEVDVEQQQRIGHLLSPLPREMRDDTAFHDRIHAYAPGWNFPKLNPADHLTNHFGLVSDFLSECWTRLRQTSRVSVLQNRVFWGGALSGRDVEAVHKTCSGLVKLLFPDPDAPVSDDDLEWVVRLALESRRRVKEQQKRCLKSEFRNTHFSFTLGVDGVEQFVSTPRATQRRGHRRRPAAARTGLGHRSRPGRDRRGSLSHRDRRRPRQRSQGPEPPRAARIPGERQGRRAESLRASQGADWRSRPARPRVHHSAPAVRRGHVRRGPRAARAHCLRGRSAGAEHGAVGRSSSDR